MSNVVRSLDQSRKMTATLDEWTVGRRLSSLMIAAVIPRYTSSSCYLTLQRVAVYVAVIGFIMVLMMRFLAAIIVWLIVVLAAVGSLGLYIVCVYC